MGASSFYNEHCSYLPAMLGWFLFSSLLSTYNKIVFGAKHYAFPCPLLVTSCHFFVQWIFSYVLTQTWPEFFGGDTVKRMDWKTFGNISVPCGLVTAADVGLSNLSLVRITVTFYTMIKASSPIFVVLSAFIFGIERITPGLILVVLVICAGEFLTVFGEDPGDFDTLGMILCLSAAVCSGLRWTLVQVKIQTLDPPLKTAIATMRVLSPSMFLFMFLWSMIVERPWDVLSPKEGGEDGGGVVYFANVENGFKTICMMLAGAAFAIAMVLCEFWLIMKSNAIVLMIGGVIKELCTIALGVTLFHDKLNPINIGGFFIVFLGVILYKVLFHMQKMQDGEGIIVTEECENNDDEEGGVEDGGRRRGRGLALSKLGINSEYRSVLPQEDEEDPNKKRKEEDVDGVLAEAIELTSSNALLGDNDDDDDDGQQLMAEVPLSIADKIVRRVGSSGDAAPGVDGASEQHQEQNFDAVADNIMDEIDELHFDDMVLMEGDDDDDKANRLREVI